MKYPCFVLKVMALLLACTGFALSDSIELRSGRHVQGKYIGGTATVVGFMTGNTIQYFATADVLAVIFDNIETPMSGALPSPMKGAIPATSQRENLHPIDTAPPTPKKKTTRLVRTRIAPSS